MLQQIIKRDRSLVPFRKEKIIFAIFKAANAVGGNDFSQAVGATVFVNLGDAIEHQHRRQWQTTTLGGKQLALT